MMKGIRPGLFLVSVERTNASEGGTILCSRDCRDFGVHSWPRCHSPGPQGSLSIYLKLIAPFIVSLFQCNSQNTGCVLFNCFNAERRKVDLHVEGSCVPKQFL